ncbi:MAG: uridine kinase [Candidatus Hinthialibacter antarcticus]|nr:uridine kinase [Candidatus Hinthialibacter antarcticus]
MRVFIIGLGGGSGGGKTTLAQQWIKRCSTPVLLLSQDRYYRDQSALSLDERREINFDHPDALENELLVQQLGALKQGREIKTPVYDFALHTRAGHETLSPAALILLEGTLIYALPDIQPLIDYRIYVDCPADLRLLRRLRRDIAERDRTFEFCAQQWEQTVKPMHEQFIEPHKAGADLLLNGEDAIHENVKRIHAAVQSLSSAS